MLSGILWRLVWRSVVAVVGASSDLNSFIPFLWREYWNNNNLCVCISRNAERVMFKYLGMCRVCRLKRPISSVARVIPLWKNHRRASSFTKYIVLNTLRMTDILFNSESFGTDIGCTFSNFETHLYWVEDFGFEMRASHALHPNYPTFHTLESNSVWYVNVIIVDVMTISHFGPESTNRICWMTDQTVNVPAMKRPPKTN